MKVRRFSQRHGYIAVLLVLSLVCAIPLLVADLHSDDDSHPAKDGSWWASAWVQNNGGYEAGDLTISSSSHSYVIWNRLQKTRIKKNELSFQVEFSHEVTRENWGIWKDGDGTWEFTKTVPANTYFASTTHGTTRDWMTVDASFKLKVYTAVRRDAQAARTSTIVRDFTTEVD